MKWILAILCMFCGLGMVELKKFCDISGNNVNHPNDFMYQVYADALLHVFEGCVTSE